MVNWSTNIHIHIGFVVFQSYGNRKDGLKMVNYFNMKIIKMVRWMENINSIMKMVN